MIASLIQQFIIARGIISTLSQDVFLSDPQGFQVHDVVASMDLVELASVVLEVAALAKGADFLVEELFAVLGLVLVVSFFESLLSFVK